MPGILERGQLPRPGARRRLIAARWHGVLQGLMGPLVIVFRTEPIEATLLGAGMRRGRSRGVRLEHRMKLLMRAILFGMAEGDPLRDNPQAHPPDRESRQAGEAGARKGAPVITADALGQSILGERALEARTGGRVGRAGQRVAAQHEATEAIA